MSFAFLYSFSDHLREAVKRGAGSLPLIPRLVPAWQIQVTKGGEVDYIAWPITEYDTAKLLWIMQANQWAAQGTGRTQPDWPLGRAEGVIKTLDSYTPGQYGSDKEATKFFKERVFVYVPTVQQARNSIEAGMRMMDPDYPWTRIVPPKVLFGVVGVLLGSFYYFHKKQ